MKTTTTTALSAIFILAAYAVIFPGRVHSADEAALDRFEYVTIRWAGRENLHVIRPSGNVEFIGAQLAKVSKPARSDDRSFYMNIALNALAKEGYELHAITSDDYIMKRKAVK